MLVVCGALAIVPMAHAAQYTVYGCQTPSGAKAPMSGWSANLDGQVGNKLEYWDYNCPANVFMFMTPKDSHPNGAFANETFQAPPGTSIDGYTFWRAVALVPSDGYYYQAFQYTSGAWSQTDGCSGPGHCGTYGDPHNPTDPVNHFTKHTPPGTTAVRLNLACGKSGGCPAVGSSADTVWLYRTAVALEDDSVPQFASAPSGPLVSGGVLTGTEPVSIGATDAGSGVYQVEFEVDGTVVQAQTLDDSNGSCQKPFTAVVPCPTSASGTVDFNTAALADGTHSLRVLVTDAAGNTTAWGPVTITTVNSPCMPTPAASGETMTAAMTHKLKHKRSRSVRNLTIWHSQRPVVHGRLVDAAGAPVPNASVCVDARTNVSGAALRRVATIATNAQGRFSYRLARGPSRRIYFIHRVVGGAISSSVDVRVHVPVTVHVNRRTLYNNQTMRWRGRLPRPVPGGLNGLLEVWRGTFWQPVGVPFSVHRNGKWNAGYTFHFTTCVQHYTFRVRVGRQSGYPYQPGTSKRVGITVRQSRHLPASCPRPKKHKHKAKKRG